MNARKAGRGVLLTGGSGYVGGLIASTLLIHEDVTIVAPVRRTVDRQRFLEPVSAEVRLAGHVFDEAMASRIHLVELPERDRLAELDDAVARFGVDEIIHSAGCLDYFNAGALESINVDLTRAFVDQGRRWNVRRFIYISTAFSSGYVHHEIAETLHAAPGKDPTDYTRTKRVAEELVAASGLPYLIARPAIIIGDSRDGHYSGKQYGLYQLWAGMERLLCREWHPEIHALAPRQPVQLVHQNAFQEAFLAAYRHLPDDRIINIVSDQQRLPDLRALWDLWLDACLRPATTFYYERMADIPLREINGKQRALLALASVNLQIAGHAWRYETSSMDYLRTKGLRFTDATRESVALCQDIFIQESKLIQEFLGVHRPFFASETMQVDVVPETTLARPAAAAAAAP
ncbi:MAG TPA: SDR family oxidoreductase [Thermoanaerobaculia bacterium]